MNKLYFILLINMIVLLHVKAQTVAIKNNLLYDVTTTLNIGAEAKLATNWTLDLSGNYNPWSFSADKKIKHWLIQPEIRYWLCESFTAHYFGAHLLYGEYNVGNMLGMKGFRYDGNFIGVGLSYGYQWLLSKRWSIETSIGIGYARLDQEKFVCGNCGQRLGESKKNYIGPTKAAVSLIYIIK